MLALSNARAWSVERAGALKPNNHRGRTAHLAVLGGLFALALATAPAIAADLKGSFSGNAYATFGNIKAGAVAATLGRSAFQGCPCNGTNGQTLTTEVDGLSAGNSGNVLVAGRTKSTSFTQKTATTAQVQTTSTVSGLNALGGLVTADTINSVATVSATTKTMTAAPDGSQFANLVVAGQSIPVNVPQNTVIPLPGLGSVTLYKVTPAGTMKGSGAITVDMITINISAKNGLGLAVGTKIVIGHALAGFSRKQPDSMFDGAAYAAMSNDKIGGVLQNKIGRSAFLSLGCRGTSGKTKTNSIAKMAITGVMSMGDGATTAFGGTEGGIPTSRMTSTVSGLNLLGGVITVGAVQAVAQSSIQGGVATGSADGSGFTSLTVAGVPVPLNVPANTTLTLPLLGTVTINEQTINNDGSVVVNGLHIKITTANLLGLPVGSELIVAHATSSIAPF
ncbi:MAG TPA: choice-of-anchor P family protein [Rhizomicrobium sp.]|nr:choice-of-anchor P family protein [Rhizomicrobium sp.]